MKRATFVGWTLVAVALVAAGVAAFVANRRQPRELALDGATARVQDGMALVDVDTIAGNGMCSCRDASGEPLWARLVRLVRGAPQAPTSAPVYSTDAGGVGLWVRLLNPVAGRGGFGFPRPSAVARFPNGDTFSMNCEAAGAYLLLTMPGGYPDSFRSVDVLFNDGSGHTARWRVVGLPPSKHAIPPPVADQRSFQSNGMTVTARAWLRAPDRRQANGGIGCELVVCGKPDPSAHWQVLQAALTPEWKANAPKMDIGYSVSEFNGPELRYRTAVPADYPHYQRFARLNCELRQYDTCLEKVVFRDISVRRTGNFFTAVVQREQTFRTPGGIVVTLPRQGDRPMRPTSSVTNGTALGIRLTFPAEAALGALPSSPLRRRNRSLRLPVWITLERLGAPWNLTGYGTIRVGSNENLVDLATRDGVMPNRISSLTLFIRQRLTVQSIPFTLTVPVEPAKPPGAE